MGQMTQPTASKH